MKKKGDEVQKTDAPGERNQVRPRSRGLNMEQDKNNTRKLHKQRRTHDNMRGEWGKGQEGRTEKSGLETRGFGM